jgi:hypothetical protein
MAKYPELTNEGYYDINLPELPDSAIAYLKSILTSPVIGHDIARGAFRVAEKKVGVEVAKDSETVRGNDPYYNATNLGKLGYRSSKGSLYSDEYGSFRECVYGAYLSGDFFELTEDLRSNQSFMRIFNEVLQKRRFYPIEKNAFISSAKLASAGVTSDTIRDYVASVVTYVKPGSYFTLRYLHKTGFEDILDDQGFEDTFYENILAMSGDLSFSDINKRKVFTTAEKFNRNDAIVDMVLTALGDEDSEYYDVLSDIILDLYGLDVSKDIRGEHKPLKFSKYTEKIYRDDETYIDELRGIQ